MIVSIEAETPTDGSKAVGIKGTFSVPNDLDCIMVAQWEATANVLGDLNELLNSKRLKWETSEPYEPRSFLNESVEKINQELKVITKTELVELGILTGRYRFRFEVKTIRNGSTITSLEVEGFAHMNMH